MISNRQLEVFVTVYEEKSMTNAGKKLFMTQPAVSQAIREIEAYYGVTLFERVGSKLYVTRSGETMYFYAKRIFTLFEEMNTEMCNVQGVREITVGVNISAGTELVRTYINRFHEEYPQIKVRVKVSRSSVLEKWLKEQELDFAIWEDLVQKADYLVQEPYYKDKIVVVASKDHPLVARENLVLKDLENQPFLLRERGAGVREKFEQLMRLNDMAVDILWESTSTKALVKAAQEGYGIAVLPYLLVKEYVENGSLVELAITDVSLKRNLNIVYHKDKVFSEPLQRLMDIVRES
ncbi:LysR family transcriptional regulator [Eubacterium oxidoreducens]|uniref:DNA-binding transcriptional regulator, LysR family n=1 Tax=Eubacterium oxidoreducens TaxID=1732 RepID=A0A1G6CA31_EUBOX|nr:LysR family transcriptional regulator [Eubacterium oxidoreducens]SDB29737.1 DNA-binding transcriptional regulator, LysR family [Eubacterium oxidoreducens]